MRRTFRLQSGLQPTTTTQIRRWPAMMRLMHDDNVFVAMERETASSANSNRRQSWLRSRHRRRLHGSWPPLRMQIDGNHLAQQGSVSSTPPVLCHFSCTQRWAGSVTRRLRLHQHVDAVSSHGHDGPSTALTATTSTAFLRRKAANARWEEY